MYNNFLPGTPVRYVGEQLIKKFPDEFKKNKLGEVVMRVPNSNALCVEFGNNSYIVSPDSLEIYVPKEKVEGPEITKILRKWNVED